MAIRELTGLTKSKRLGRVYGGPFEEIVKFALPGDVTIKLAAEINAPHDLRVDTQDFSVPRDEQQIKYALLVAAQALADGKDVYAGCKGGIGRTGLFMAILGGAMNQHRFNNPISEVRRTYLSHAVETEPQQRFVYRFLDRNRGLIKLVRAILRQHNKKGSRRKAKKISRESQTPLTKVA